MLLKILLQNLFSWNTALCDIFSRLSVKRTLDGSKYYLIVKRDSYSSEVNFNSFVKSFFGVPFECSTFVVKILRTSHMIALLRSLITCSPLPTFICFLNQTPFDHHNI